MPNTAQNSVPNSNDLFAIFQAQVETVGNLQDVIVKCKIDKKTIKRVEEAASVVSKSLDAVYSVLNEIANKNIKNADTAVANATALSNSLLPLFQVIDLINTMKLTTTIMAHIRIHRMRGVIDHLWLFVFHTSLVPPVITTVSIKVLEAMSSVVMKLVDTINAVSKINFIKVFTASRGIKHLDKLMFGVRGKSRGLVGIITKFNNTKYNKGKIVAGAFALSIIGSTVKKFSVTIIVLGVILPLAALAWVTTKLLSVIIKGLARTFAYVGRKFKSIVKGSLALEFMSVALMIAVTSLILTGLAAMMGVKVIGIAMVVILGIVGMVCLISLASGLIKRGAKAIRRIALAVALLGMVAITMALLGTFVVANWQGFLITAAFLAILIGVFFLLTLVSKFVKKGAKTLVLVALAVSLLAMTAVLMAILGQYVEANLGQILLIGVFMGILVAIVYIIAKKQKVISKGLLAIVVVVVFSLLMSLTIFILAEIADSHDMGSLLACALAMVLVVGAVGAIAVVAGKLHKDIIKGLPAMAIIVGVSLLMSMVMKNIAEAAAIAPPLEILEVTGIMLLIAVAIGGIAIAAGALLAGPQAILFGLGLVALGSISAIGLLMSEVVKSAAEAAKAVEESGYTDAAKLSDLLKLPLKAMLDEGDDGKSVFGYISDMPNFIKMGVYADKVRSLNNIMSSIGSIADVLQHIASLNMPDPDAGYDENGKPLGYKQMTTEDFRRAAINSGVILGTVSAMFADDPTDFEMGDGTKFTLTPVSMEGLDKIGWMTKIKVKRLASIVDSIGNMADVLQHIASLNMPTEWNQDGKAVNFRQMTPDDFTVAAGNAGSILTYFASLFADEPTNIMVLGKSVTIGSQRAQWMQGLDNISRSVRRKVERLGDIVKCIGNMADTIQKLASLQIPDPEAGFDENGKPLGYKVMDDTDFTKSSENLGIIIKHVIGAVSDPVLAKQLEDMDEDAAENFATILAPMTSIANVVDVIKQLGEDTYVISWKTDENGNQIPDKTGKFSDLAKNSRGIQSKLTSIMGIVIGAVSVFESDEYWEDQLDDAEDAIEDLMEVIQNATPCIEGILNLYKNNIESTDVSKMKSGFNCVFDATKTIISISNTRFDPDDMDEVTEAIINFQSPLEELLKLHDEYLSNVDPTMFRRRFSALTTSTGYIIDMLAGKKIKKSSAKVIQKNIREVRSLLKQVDSTDLDKLKTTADLMKHIADLSKSINGNFKALAEAINEDLLEALEKLTGALDSVNEKDFNVSVAGDVINTPSGSAGVKDKQNPSTPDNKTSNDKDIKALVTKIGSLISELQSITNGNKSVAVKVSPN